MRVVCDLNKCVNCMNTECQLNTLMMEDGECLAYADITDGPDYQEIYWTANRYVMRDGEEIRYRIMKRGKRVEHEGIVAYTDDDTRYGLEGTKLTEKKTGFLIGGDQLLDEEVREHIKEMIEREKDVMSLPWMDYKGADVPPVPHEEG